MNVENRSSNIEPSPSTVPVSSPPAPASSPPAPAKAPSAPADVSLPIADHIKSPVALPKPVKRQQISSSTGPSPALTGVKANVQRVKERASGKRPGSPTSTGLPPRPATLEAFKESLQSALTKPSAQELIARAQRTNQIVQTTLAELHGTPHAGDLHNRKVYIIPTKPPSAGKAEEAGTPKGPMIGLHLGHLGKGHDKVANKIALVTINQLNQLVGETHLKAYFETHTNPPDQNELFMWDAINQFPDAQRDRIITGHNVLDCANGSMGGLAELCDGDLRHVLVNESGVMSPVQQSDILLQMLQACDQLQNLEILHRDLNMGNWLYKKVHNEALNVDELHVYAADFTRSTFARGAQDKPDLFIPAFVPPALLTNPEGDKVPGKGWNSYKLNVYQAAISAYQLFSKAVPLPWENMSPAEALLKIQNPESWPGFDKIPPELQNVLKQIIVGDLENIPDLKGLIAQLGVIKEKYVAEHGAKTAAEGAARAAGPSSPSAARPSAGPGPIPGYSYANVHVSDEEIRARTPPRAASPGAAPIPNYGYANVNESDEALRARTPKVSPSPGGAIPNYGYANVHEGEDAFRARARTPSPEPSTPGASPKEGAFPSYGYANPPTGEARAATPSSPIGQAKKPSPIDKVRKNPIRQSRMKEAKDRFIATLVKNGLIEKPEGNVSFVQCREIYKQAALKYHPDKIHEGDEKFKLLDGAWEKFGQVLQKSYKDTDVNPEFLRDLDSVMTP